MLDENRRNDKMTISGIVIDYYSYMSIVCPGEQMARMPVLHVKEHEIDKKWYIQLARKSRPYPANCLIVSGYIDIPFETEEAAYTFQQDCINNSIATYAQYSTPR